MGSTLNDMEAKIVRMAAKAGAEAAMATIERERKKEAREAQDRRLHNTKLLLRNYRAFKENAENAVFRAQELIDEKENDIIALMSDRDTNDDVVVRSIQQSATRTVIIVKHIDTALEVYERICASSGSEVEQRRYDIIRQMYILPFPSKVSELAEKYHVDERTIYLDIDMACKRIAPLIGGVDWLDKLLQNYFVDTSNEEC